MRRKKEDEVKYSNFAFISFAVKKRHFYWLRHLQILRQSTCLLKSLDVFSVDILGRSVVVLLLEQQKHVEFVCPNAIIVISSSVLLVSPHMVFRNANAQDLQRTITVILIYISFNVYSASTDCWVHSNYGSFIMDDHIYIIFSEAHTNINTVVPMLRTGRNSVISPDLFFFFSLQKPASLAASVWNRFLSFFLSFFCSCCVVPFWFRSVEWVSVCALDILKIARFIL